MLIHQPHHDGDDWHVVYTIPGTTALHSVAAGLTHRAAQREAGRLNAEQASKQTVHVEPAERRIPPGFYQDNE